MSLPVASQPTMPQVRNANKSLAAPVDGLVALLTQANLLSGAILVTRGDRVIFLRAYGFASWELRVPNTPQTRFGIASISNR